MANEQRIRVLIAKPGLDGHDRGAKVVARALRDAGMEVIYTGIRQTPAMIAEAALQEDAQVVGLSILSGAHLELFPRVVDELKQRGVDDVLLFCGGIIPQEDIEKIKAIGFQGVFGPGTNTGDIIEFVKAHAPVRT
ncbi:MAG: cobalamin B12-binding domain-containing protein [Chloroflexi bacterium]|nr:cobalamin B12-binding domain-containing protein [Chloroflexota bacterium]MDA1001732.1 cobalamin B12-binding domain-containing protein [Chloroflexota bacterium]